MNVCNVERGGFWKVLEWSVVERSTFQRGESELRAGTLGLGCTRDMQLGAKEPAGAEKGAGLEVA